MRRTRLLSSLLATGSVVGTVALPSTVRAASRTSSVTVRPGGSIQAALDNARPGSRVVVSPGTYVEQLVIRTSGITLEGRSVTLVAPKTPQGNACTGVTRVGPPDVAVATDAGICVIGEVTFGDFDPVLNHRPARLTGKRISDVTINGIAVSGFGTGIIVAGGDNTTIDGVAVTKAESYGVLAANSPRTTYARNTVVNGAGTIAAIGLCVEGSEKSELRRNEVSGYVNGLCISSSHTRVEGNNLHDNHFGIYVDPGITDVDLIDNKVVDNNRVDPAPIPTGIGIFIEGATDIRLRGNTIARNVGDNTKDFGGMGAGGLVIVDHDVPPPASMSSRIVATGNRFTNNGDGTTSADIWNASNGKGMSLSRNPGCTTSVPKGQC